MSGEAPRHAIVTGATAGLGRALADRLLATGWGVVGVDRNPPALPLGKSYEHCRYDLSDADAVDDLVKRLAARPDVVDSLEMVVLCAGVSATGRFERLPAEAHERVLAVNAEAPLVLADALLAAGWSRGVLVLVASLSVDVGYPGAASYAASKDALAAYGRSLTKARRRPRVLTVLPGPIRTEHAARHAPEGSSDARRMDPNELADRILRAARRGGGTLRPGVAATLAGGFGRLAPGMAARLMRRGLFDRLTEERW